MKPIGQCKYLFVFCIIQLFFQVGNTKTWYLKRGEQNLQMMIDQAAPGDSVLVGPGTYFTKNLVIRKPIVLIGDEKPVLDGEGLYEILTISGNNIRVTGFVLMNSGYSSMNDYAAIKCIDASEIYIEDNEILHSFFGIHVSNASKIYIRNNVVVGNPKTEQNTGNGIHLWKCNHALIEGNRVSGHRDGIYFEFVTDSKIRCNYSKGNIRYGLHFMFSHRDDYEENQFVANGAGVAVMYSKEVHMLFNEFVDNWGGAAYGILLKDITDSKIFYNRFNRNTVGIYMEGSSRMMIQRNVFTRNGWAMKVQASCSDNRINENNFQGNSFDMATNGTLVLNNFDENYWDKYEGYDRTRDGIGDVPYRPVNMYSMIVEQNPFTLILLRSILISFLDKAEKAIPSFTPELLMDRKPLMKPVAL